MSKELEDKLDILIKLVASTITKEDNSQTESILKLNSMGLGSRDIAQIINSSENYVSMSLSRSKKKGAKKNGK